VHLRQAGLQRWGVGVLEQSGEQGQFVLGDGQDALGMAAGLPAASVAL
jgi:hypothetical protein